VKQLKMLLIKNNLNILRFAVLTVAINLRYQESLADMHQHELSLCLWRQSNSGNCDKMYVSTYA